LAARTRILYNLEGVGEVPFVAGQPAALPRCCDRHDDWPTLARHLVNDFPELSARDVVRELRTARDAAAATGLADNDSLHIAETIARHQLLLRSGRTGDMARLDPERHDRARGSD
jgi:hypothetical protein